MEALLHCLGSQCSTLLPVYPTADCVSHHLLVDALQTDYYWLWLGILVLIGYTVVFNGDRLPRFTGYTSLTHNAV